MADTMYEYDVIDDFINDSVEPGKLGEEIEAAGITSANYTHTTTRWKGNPARDKCEVWFDDPLSAGDETTLDGVIAVHAGLPEQGDFDFDEPVISPTFKIEDDNVHVSRSGDNMTFTDVATGTKTLAEVSSGAPDMSKLLIEMDGSFVVDDAGEILEVT